MSINLMLKPYIYILSLNISIIFYRKILSLNSSCRSYPYTTLLNHYFKRNP